MKPRREFRETRNREFNPGSMPNRGFTLATHSVEIEPGVTLDKTRLPSCIVYVRQAAVHLRAFYRFCANNSIGVTVWGAPDPETGRRPKVVRMGGPRTELVDATDPNGKPCQKRVCVDESVCGQCDAWEVVGDPDAVRALWESEFVYQWHPIVANRVPVKAGGAGAEKEKASKPREKSTRDATARAVVTGNELNEDGERVATWQLRKPRADGTAD